MWNNSSKVYLPPTQPIARVLSTKEYVQTTGYYYHGQSERLITVGHPFYPVYNEERTKIVVPQVSANQLRAFRIKLPDPNKFVFADPNFYNPETHRLVWLLKAIEIGRGGPLGVGCTGHPFFNKIDTENPNKYPKTDKDDRMHTSFDPKHCQMFVVGCKPCIGSHWGLAKSCVDAHNPDVDEHCPPIQLVNSFIEDGDMGDIGLGNMDFLSLQEDRSCAPLEIVTKKCKFPDFLKMQAEASGDSMFFYGRKESLYARHMFSRVGKNGEEYPHPVEPSDYILPSADAEDMDRQSAAAPLYFATPSGSLNASDSQLFNRAYFLRNSQGPNNGVLWNNEMFVTTMDNSRNTNFTISIAPNPTAQYDATKIKYYMRHVEIYELMFVLEVGKIELNGTVLAHINAMNPSVIDSWNLGFVPMPTSTTEDTYRFLDSLATKCPADVVPEKKDPYDGYSFWEVDCTEKMTMELDQYPLGRKFLAQRFTARPRTTLKRPGVRKSTAAKKRRK